MDLLPQQKDGAVSRVTGAAGIGVGSDAQRATRVRRTVIAGASGALWLAT